MVQKPGEGQNEQRHQTRAKYTYYGLGQRATGWVDADLVPPGGVPYDYLDEISLYYYDLSWRLLERRIDRAYTESNDPFGSSGTGDPSGFGDSDGFETHQFVWGLSYIDELLFFQKDRGGGVGGSPDQEFNDTSDTGHYAVLDRDYSPIRVGYRNYTEYDAYGQPRVTDTFGDYDMNGSIDVFDSGIIQFNFGTQSGATYRQGDMDGDGDVDVFDWSDFLTAFNSGHPRTRFADGEVSIDGMDNIVGFAGYLFEEATGLYCVRNRWYDPEHGRWLSRDPLGYGDGMHLYQYARSSPYRYLDPTGLKVKIRGSVKDQEAALRALQVLCPDVRFQQDPAGGGTMITLDDETHDDEACDDPCDDPPGCMILKSLIESDSTYEIKTGHRRGKYKDSMDPKKKDVHWSDESRPYRRRPAEGDSTDDDGLVEDRDAKSWEILWHELLHLYHLDQGIYRHWPDYNEMGLPNKGDAWEEVLTIVEMNKLRDWYNKCKGGNLPHRDERAHPTPWDRLPRRKEAPEPWIESPAEDYDDPLEVMPDPAPQEGAPE